MKKLFLIIVLLAMVGSSIAQDIYAVGYFGTSGSKGVLYKNGSRLYTAHSSSYPSMATKLALNSGGDVYWILEFRTMNGEYHHSEILKNNEVLPLPDGIQPKDIYCLNDTLYTLGQYYNSDTVMVGTVLKGDGFSPYWEFGDGIHPTYICDADVDKRTGIPYFCGYTIIDGISRTAVWKENDLLFEGQEAFIQGEIADSQAFEISVDNGHVFTLGREYNYIDDVYMKIDVIWKDNEYYKTSGDFLGTLCAFGGEVYYSYTYPHGMIYYVTDGHQILLDFGLSGYGENRIYSSLSDIYICGHNDDNKGCVWKNFEVYQQFGNNTNLLDIVVSAQSININNEWYYEIQNDNGTITYQHLECQTDTVIENKRPKVIVRSNTQYDKDGHTEVTHEYVYEENGKVYWWNKDLQEFTTLYDFAAVEGEEWEIKVGTESIVMHVDTVGYYENEGNTYRMLRVSDENGIFSGDIVSGIGHLTSFFPERLMNRNANYTVDGLRCYWADDELLYHFGDDDCDAIYTELHGVEEMNENGFAVYPNPANSVLYVEVLPMGQKYQITNLMGQTLLQGYITSENQQIDIANLPAGMYFVSVGEHSVKFVVQ